MSKDELIIIERQICKGKLYKEQWPPEHVMQLQCTLASPSYRWVVNTLKMSAFFRGENTNALVCSLNFLEMPTAIMSTTHYIYWNILSVKYTTGIECDQSRTVKVKPNKQRFCSKKQFCYVCATDWQSFSCQC